MKYVITALLILGVFNIHQTSLAVDGYQPLSPLPSIAGSSPTDSSSDFSGYVIQLYQWGVALTSGLAVVVIMWGGVGYVTSAGGGGIEEAKGRISAAIMGLLLALSSYIILKTINQDLLNVNFNLDPLPVSTGGRGTVTPTVVQPAPSSRAARDANGTDGSLAF